MLTVEGIRQVNAKFMITELGHGETIIGGLGSEVSFLSPILFCWSQ